MKKKCINCDIELFGRHDKKFCGDSCRNQYNNNLNSDKTNYVRNITNVLRRNRRILSELSPTDKATVHRDQMLLRGFDFNYFTNYYTTKTGKTYHFCFEYGFLPLEKDFYMIVLRQEYVR